MHKITNTYWNKIIPSTILTSRSIKRQNKIMNAYLGRVPLSLVFNICSIYWKIGSATFIRSKSTIWNLRRSISNIYFDQITLSRIFTVRSIEWEIESAAHIRLYSIICNSGRLEKKVMNIGLPTLIWTE